MPRALGHVLGAPGPVGSPSICILYGQGPPSAQVVDPTMDNVANCQLSSEYHDYTTPGLWFKTGPSSGANPNGVWTQITIP
jgi:hypothetical protein